MKISEMTFKKGCEVMLRIAAPCANLSNDARLTNEVKNGQTLALLLVQVLQNHSADGYEIACALLDKTAAEIDEMKFEDVYNELLGSYDGVLRGFFTSSASTPPSTGRE